MERMSESAHTPDPSEHVFAYAEIAAAQYRGYPLPNGLIIRRARTADVAAISELIAPLVEERILLGKEKVNLFENLHEFWLVADPHAEGGERLAGCAAMHVIWEDLAEARTVATSPDYRRRGVGRALIEQIVADARLIGVGRIFCLTFETEFFGAMGFEEIEGTPVDAEVYAELLRSHDEGVAEFLDLARVKPNTLGNSRMLLEL